MNWQPHPKSHTALVNEHGDVIAKTFDGHEYRYEAHVKGGPSKYRFTSADTAKEWVSKQRKAAA